MNHCYFILHVKSEKTVLWSIKFCCISRYCHLFKGNSWNRWSCIGNNCHDFTPFGRFYHLLKKPQFKDSVIHYTTCTCFFVVCHLSSTQASLVSQQAPVQALWKKKKVQFHRAPNLQYKNVEGTNCSVSYHRAAKQILMWTNSKELYPVHPALIFVIHSD